MQLAKYHRLDRQLEVLGVLSTIPAGERGACIEHMMQLAKYYGLDRQLEVLGVLRTIPAGERGACIERMMQLAKYHGLDRQLEVLGVLSTIPAGERAACVAQAEHLPLTLHNATPVVKLAAARIIVEAPSGQGEQFSAQLLEFDSRGDIIVIFGGMADHATRQSIAIQVLRICTPTTLREDRIKVVNLLKEMSPADLQALIDSVVQILAPLTEGHRSHLIDDLSRVPAAHRLAFVNFIIGNGVTEIEYITALSRIPDPHDWLAHLAQLRAARRAEEERRAERVAGIGRAAPGASVVGVTIEDVHAELDRQPLRIDRTAMVNWELPEITTETYTSGKMSQRLQELFNSLNLTDNSKSDFLGASLFDDTWPAEVGAANESRFNTRVKPQVAGKLKTVWGIPLDPGEIGGWTMYGEQRDAFKKAVSHIFEQMASADSERLSFKLVFKFIEVDSNKSDLRHCLR
jgi:hypothetical protein